jgi:hypothetical protein
MAADSENRLRESMGVYFAEPDRRTSENSAKRKFNFAEFTFYEVR